MVPLVVLFGFTIPEVTVLLTVLTTMGGLCRRYRITPRRCIGWLVSVKNAETDRAAALYWEGKYRDCLGDLDDCEGRKA